MYMKLCTKCNIEKLETQYFKDLSKKGGLRNICKVCCKIYQKEYQSKNKEQISQQRHIKHKENYKSRAKPKSPKFQAPDLICVNLLTGFDGKICTGCKQLKNLIAFSNRSKRDVQLKAKCKSCEVKRALIYNKENKDKHYEFNKKYRAKKRKNNEIYALEITLRARLVGALKRQYWTKNSRFKDILGCSLEELKNHLEKQFKSDMTWNNRGKYGWHVDHIIPLSSAETKEELYKLCHYTNLQPLWAIDNLKKGSKVA